MRCVPHAAWCMVRMHHDIIDMPGTGHADGASNPPAAAPNTQAQHIHSKGVAAAVALPQTKAATQLPFMFMFMLMFMFQSCPMMHACRTWWPSALSRLMASLTRGSPAFSPCSSTSSLLPPLRPPPPSALPVLMVPMGSSEGGVS